VERPSESNAAKLEALLRGEGVAFERSAEGGAVRFDTRLGKHKAVVMIFDTGSVLVQGADSPLRSLLRAKAALEAGGDPGDGRAATREGVAVGRAEAAAKRLLHDLEAVERLRRRGALDEVECLHKVLDAVDAARIELRECGDEILRQIRRP
jgi:hypothetical protein